MPLFRRRRELRAKAERVASGTPIALTTEFPMSARNRILFAIIDSDPHDIGTSFAHLIQGVLLREWGVLTLAGNPDTAKDLHVFIANHANDEQILDVIEAVFVVFQEERARLNIWTELQEERAFRERVNVILDEHDLAYQVVGAEVIPRESMAMHAGVVAPALALLHGDSRLRDVERAFQDALKELKPRGNPSDAITDAGTALQEMLRALGARGNALSPLLGSARQKGLLGPHDSKLAEGVELIGHWVSADRSTRGDSHLVTDASPEDAWLAVHVVGALILRLEKRL